MLAYTVHTIGTSDAILLAVHKSNANSNGRWRSPSPILRPKQSLKNVLARTAADCLPLGAQSTYLRLICSQFESLLEPRAM